LFVPVAVTNEAYDSTMLLLPSTRAVVTLLATKLLSPLTSIISADASTLFKPKFVCDVNPTSLGFSVSHTTEVPNIETSSKPAALFIASLPVYTVPVFQFEYLPNPSCPWKSQSK